MLLITQVLLGRIQCRSDKPRELHTAGGQILTDRDALVDGDVESENPPDGSSDARAGHIRCQQIQADTKDQRGQQGSLSPEPLVPDGAVDSALNTGFG